MNLLDLPPELLGRILELSTAPDFENLSKQLSRATLYASGIGFEHSLIYA
jgi:hypothetical protein